MMAQRRLVLDALAAGKAVIGTSLAFEGLDFLDAEQALVAESDVEFADAALELLSNEWRRIAIASSARGWTEASVSWDSPVATYNELYQSLVGGPVPSIRLCAS